MIPEAETGVTLLRARGDGHQQELRGSKPGSYPGSQREHSAADALTSDFTCLELRKNTFLSVKGPGWWRVVTAALGG